MFSLKKGSIGLILAFLQKTGMNWGRLEGFISQRNELAGYCGTFHGGH